MKLLAPDAAPAVAIGADPRWVDLFVRLLGDTRLRIFAKETLKHLAPLAVKESVLRVVGPPVKPPKPAPLDMKEVEAADARADAFAKQLRTSLEEHAARLKKAKASPRAKGKALLTVDATITAGKIAEIEKLTKIRLPALLRAFYMFVGPVDFRPGGLYVQPIDRALRDLKRRVRENTGVPLPLRAVLALELAPEIAVRIDEWTFDPRLEGSDGSLLEHLRAAIPP